MTKIATTGDDHHTTITYHTDEEEASSSDEEASVFNFDKLRITRTRFELYTMKIMIFGSFTEDELKSLQRQPPKTDIWVMLEAFLARLQAINHCHEDFKSSSIAALAKYNEANNNPGTYF